MCTSVHVLNGWCLLWVGVGGCGWVWVGGCGWVGVGGWGGGVGGGRTGVNGHSRLELALYLAPSPVG